MKCCDIKAGDLRHVIIIERLTNTPDGMGGSETTWATFATLRARVSPISANERLFAMRTEADTTHRILIRYNSGITSTDRVNFGGRLMQITGIIDIEEMHRWMEISATEGEAT